MRRVLIISPHFPPVNAPDYQRARMLLPHLREYGWEPEVMAVDPDWVRAPRDPSLLRTIPDEVVVHKVRGIPPSWTRPWGFDNLAWRNSCAIHRTGSRLLATGRFQLVFFSTTQSAVIASGPVWKRKFGIAYVLDIQDPLVNDYYLKTGTPPPGGKWKYAWAQRRARKLEQRVLPEAAHVISVSPRYPVEIARRVPAFTTDRTTVLPFPFSLRDIELAGKCVRPEWLPQGDYILSAGRGGADLDHAIRAFFLALSWLPVSRRMPAYFVGTAYGNPDKHEKPIEKMAQPMGISSIVHEIPQRQAYLDVIAAQSSSRLNCVFGSLDPSYQASKLMPLLAIGCPVLAVLHRDSEAAKFLQESAPEYLCEFDPAEGIEPLASRIKVKLKNLPEQEDEVKWEKSNDLLSRVADFEAGRQARRVAEIFNQCVK